MIMSFVSVCAWIAWIVVIQAINPMASGSLGYIMFYSTLGIAFLSSVSLLGTVVRVWSKKQEIVYRQVLISLRQGLILTGVFLSALLLSAQGLFVWWALLLLIIIAGFLELVFMSSRTSS